MDRKKFDKLKKEIEVTESWIESSIERSESRRAETMERIERERETAAEIAKKLDTALSQDNYDEFRRIQKEYEYHREEAEFCATLIKLMDEKPIESEELCKARIDALITEFDEFAKDAEKEVAKLIYRLGQIAGLLGKMSDNVERDIQIIKSKLLRDDRIRYSDNGIMRKHDGVMSYLNHIYHHSVYGSIIGEDNFDRQTEYPVHEYMAIETEPASVDKEPKRRTKNKKDLESIDDKVTESDTVNGNSDNSDIVDGKADNADTVSGKSDKPDTDSGNMDIPDTKNGNSDSPDMVSGSVDDADITDDKTTNRKKVVNDE